MVEGEVVQPARTPTPGTPRPAAPPPLRALDVDGIGVILTGTLVFVVLSVVAVLDRRRLEAEGHGWWVAVAVTGVGLGLLVLGYAVRRRRHTHPTT